MEKEARMDVNAMLIWNLESDLEVSCVLERRMIMVIWMWLGVCTGARKAGDQEISLKATVIV